MSRTYELCFIVDPRQSDDDAQAICDKYLGLVRDTGATITHLLPWGKRKLAYPINKLNEGKYFVVYASSPEGVSWVDVERLMMQDELILRHLVVRTDQDLKRAERGKIQPTLPEGVIDMTNGGGSAAEAEAEAEEGASDGA